MFEGNAYATLPRRPLINGISQYLESFTHSLSMACGSCVPLMDAAKRSTRSSTCLIGIGIKPINKALHACQWRQRRTSTSQFNGVFRVVCERCRLPLLCIMVYLDRVMTRRSARVDCLYLSPSQRPVVLCPLVYMQLGIGCRFSQPVPDGRCPSTAVGRWADAAGGNRLSPARKMLSIRPSFAPVWRWREWSQRLSEPFRSNTIHAQQVKVFFRPMRAYSVSYWWTLNDHNASPNVKWNTFHPIIEQNLHLRLSAYFKPTHNRLRTSSSQTDFKRCLVELEISNHRHLNCEIFAIVQMVWRFSDPIPTRAQLDHRSERWLSLWTRQNVEGDHADQYQYKLYRRSNNPIRFRWHWCTPIRRGRIHLLDTGCSVKCFRMIYSNNTLSIMKTQKSITLSCPILRLFAACSCSNNAVDSVDKNINNINLTLPWQWPI